MKKNWLTLLLIFSSTALLLVLQVIWLQSVYRNAKRDLRREASFLFASTIVALQDSVVEKNIRPLPGDTTAEFFGNIPSLRDTVRYDHHRTVEIQRRQPDDVRVFFSADEPRDSLRRFYRPLLSKIRTNRRQRTFVMQITMDSLKPDGIKKKYAKALTKAEIPLNFSILHTNSNERQRESYAGLSTDPFPFSPRNSYYIAQFPDVRGFILEKHLPQILFSVFLTLLTSVSFLVMYRSMRSNQRLVSIKNDFIGNITHELKTPIATVSVAIEALKNFKGPGNPHLTEEYLSIAQHELNRLSLLTDKVLKTAIFEDQGITIQLEKIEMDKIIDDVLSSLKLVVEKYDATIDFQKKGKDFLLSGSADHLANVVYNLIDNALKYSHGKPQVSILLEDLNDRISFSVLDKGLGIPAEYQKKVFEKFFRVPTGDLANTKGYGLGLSYVEGVVHKHKGTVSLESKLTEGSIFVIILPKHRG